MCTSLLNSIAAGNFLEHYELKILFSSKNLKMLSNCCAFHKSNKIYSIKLQKKLIILNPRWPPYHAHGNETRKLFFAFLFISFTLITINIQLNELVEKLAQK